MLVIQNCNLPSCYQEQFHEEQRSLRDSVVLTRAVLRAGLGFPCCLGVPLAQESPCYLYSFRGGSQSGSVSPSDRGFCGVIAEAQL